VATVLVIGRTHANAEAVALALNQVEHRITTHAATAADAREVAYTCSPNVAAIDLGVEVGLRLVRDLVRRLPALRVVVYGCSNDKRERSAWADAGATRVVSSSASLGALVECVRADLRRTTHSEQKSHFATPNRYGRVARAADLTQREREVTRLIALGLSNREIAETLCLELPTVKNHIQHLMRKLGVHRRADAARILEGRPINDLLSGPAGDSSLRQPNDTFVRVGASTARQAVFRAGSAIPSSSAKQGLLG
jgi:DNA-binding NarL/FixJ family response regulator